MNKLGCHFIFIMLVSSSVVKAQTPPPELRDDAVTTPLNTPAAVSMLANDTGGDWVSGSFTQAANGVVSGSVLNNGTIPSLLYTPNVDFVGTDLFTYSMTESNGSTHTATITVTVDPTGPGIATLPQFTCGNTNEVCNVTQVAGLGGDVGYGRGTAFVDVNGDGWDDIFVADTDGRFNPEHIGFSKFYLNQGNGTFQEADLGLDPDDLKGTWGGSFADFDNDGDQDLLIVNGGYTARSTLAFYVNQINVNGKFVPATDISGIGVANSIHSNWWGASWADYDNDGFLDIIVTRTKGRPLLFHNNQGTSFSEVGVNMGIDIDFIVNQTVFENAKNPVWIDYDLDGDPDLYFSGVHKHGFYENVGGIQFVDVTKQVFKQPIPANVNWPPESPLVHAAAAEDFNQDGWDDLYLGRWDEQDIVFFNNKNGEFLPMGQEIGLDTLKTTWSQITQPYENSMGLGVGDFTNNGFPDVYVGTGNPERADADVLYCNTKDTGFIRCTDMLTVTADRVYRTRAHGTVFADVDHDGNTDMYVNLGGHPHLITDFTSDVREQNALWVRPNAPALTATLTLVGTDSNRDGIGAKVQVQSGTQVNFYAVRSTQAFQSQNSKSLVVSLANSESGTVRVLWPSGKTNEVQVNVGDRINIVE